MDSNGIEGAVLVFLSNPCGFRLEGRFTNTYVLRHVGVNG